MINKLLAPFGFKLVRKVGKTLSFPPSQSERNEVDDLIHEFVKNQPAGTNLADAGQWKNYLSNRRLSFFHEIIDLLARQKLNLEPAMVLDYGSGTGYLLRCLAKAIPTARLRGYDTFDAANELARKICPSGQFTSEKPSADSRFSLMFCTEVLEHLVDPKSQLEELVRMLIRGGLLIVTVPDGRIDAEPARDMRDDNSAYWGHIHFWSPESWRLFVSDCVNNQASIETDILESGENIALIRKS